MREIMKSSASAIEARQTNFATHSRAKISILAIGSAANGTEAAARGETLGGLEKDTGSTILAVSGGGRIWHHLAMPYPPDNPPRVFSILAAREVSTWSEEWKHECEVRLLANMTLAERNRTLDGEKDGLKGMKNFRGDGAVAQLRAEIDRYAGLKSSPT